MKKMFIIPIAAIALAACSDHPAGMLLPDSAATDEVVITPGITAPAPRTMPMRPVFSNLKDATPSLGGSTTSPVRLNGAGCTGSPAQRITITYTVSGTQQNPASFQVHTRWDFDGDEFAGSEPVTVNVPAGSGNPRTYSVEITIGNASGAGTGTTTFAVAPFGVVTTSGSPGQRLNIDTSSTATVHIAFTDCAPANEPPSITIPADITAEATSSAGAAVSFSVSASDPEDGDLTDAIVCKVGDDVVTSGHTFPLGEHTVRCVVEDSGALTAEGSFTITVQDTTPAEFTSFPGNQTLIAENINGTVLDINALGITVADWNGVSEPSTYACGYAAGTWLAIGSITTVSCTATDAIGNESGPSTFDVFVTLDGLDGLGFLSPLRGQPGPYSAHKAGSAIPHKFRAPRYRDGTPATDLAGGLRLVLTYSGNAIPSYDSTENDISAGSTVWRWDADSEHYIFNLKSAKDWKLGDWMTTVSYAGIPLAETYFEFRK